ncbi:hypothetical protein L0657_04735 [Dyadobacter sp. CY345]|uniref:hypothetical protein n=1 Tax=Dyadobacter sp. CY345 TaxID=2909335 RepID=UPI001F42497A|nr:hypothetical protein [Dyadobacter sp. CY345]MCF2443253.1 hypothetical protein [Dyadobacter sp. CY345]
MSFFALFLPGAVARAQQWQWSVSVDSIISKETQKSPIAYLWIPPDCKRVRGVVVGQNNMIEQGILENEAFRKTMAEIGFAQVWVDPAFDQVFQFDKGIGTKFNAMMKKLGSISGYTELEFAPVVPIGHSAAASFPWNFGAWSPDRTLAMLSIHGDAPQTDLTGSGQPNPDWAGRQIDGVPGLMVMGEYEWWDARLTPALKFRQLHPDAPVSLLADAGRGHFDFSEDLIGYLAVFIKKAAALRLPKHLPLNRYPKLDAVAVKNGWLADRWHQDRFPAQPSAPYHSYQGNQNQAFWYFDKEMAELTEKYYGKARQKKQQYIGYCQSGALLPFNQKSHARIQARFVPLHDGVSFHISGVYTDSLRYKLASEHAKSQIDITRITGPVKKVNDSTFTVSFNRSGFDNPKRSNDIWLMAASDGDQDYKSAVQQLNLKIPLRNDRGLSQTIQFSKLNDLSENSPPVALGGKSDRDLPVHYYVQQGPAIIRESQLVLTKIPPRTKFPVKVTVVAWQYGTSKQPEIQSAAPVSQTFYVQKKK